jgi:hypothetical protein
MTSLVTIHTLQSLETTVNISQQHREIDQLAHRLQVVRELSRSNRLGAWARDHWRTVERQLERKWQFLKTDMRMGGGQ